eukprot:CAMPEP_0179046284 /NCGR_PEP_ID=MMETSP0796-20121207/18608_1 /TAXON_ID=73915 /ORGANISM="Pyrodinium bahamense, Strain pbaha01" /LENGTH=179 /DNA_ID=CAMNT_0020742705 /DNA_START=264 /DNA_END=805 /DNA_ORIENTATION=+
MSSGKAAAHCQMPELLWCPIAVTSVQLHICTRNFATVLAVPPLQQFTNTLVSLQPGSSGQGPEVVAILLLQLAEGGAPWEHSEWERTRDVHVPPPFQVTVWPQLADVENVGEIPLVPLGMSINEAAVDDAVMEGVWCGAGQAHAAIRSVGCAAAPRLSVGIPDIRASEVAALGERGCSQ